MEKSKFSAKIKIWGAITATWASARHILLRNQTVAAQFYQKNILAPFFLEEIHRNLNTGPITEIKFHENTWDLVCQQDEAPAHTALTSQIWLRKKLPKLLEQRSMAT